MTASQQDIPRVSVAKRALVWGVLVSVAVAAFAGAEFYTRATRPHRDLLVLTGRRSGPNPDAEWGVVDAFSAYRARPGAYGVDKTVNRYGFISTPDLALQKPEGDVRLVFLGESSTAGTGRDLGDTVTWPWQVTEILRRRLPRARIDFVNAALGGYTSFESFGRLWSRVRPFSPDIVVVNHGWNELYYFNRADRIFWWRTLRDGSWTLDRTDSPIALLRPLWVDRMIWPSQLLTYVRLRLSDAAQGGEVDASRCTELSHAYDRGAPEIFRANLRLIRDAVRLMGAEVYVAKQSTLIVPNLPDSLRPRVHYEFHGFDHAAHVAAFRAIYRVITDEIPADHVIRLDTLSGRPEYFYDHVHPTPAGARAIAHAVADAIFPAVARRAAHAGRQ